MIFPDLFLNTGKGHIMSTKVFKKVENFLAPFLFVAVISVVALSMRLYFMAEELPDAIVTSFSVHKLQKGAGSKIDQTIIQMQRSIMVAIEDFKTTSFDNEQKKEMSEVDLILSYVDEITTVYYPRLDAGLIKAIIYRETRYDPTQVNPKSGTTGLMQISPKWHSARAAKLGVDDLKDPYGNILVGCDFLNELIEDYSCEYAINVYAGGYKYANRYQNTKSPVVKDLIRIKEDIESGKIIPGGG